MMMHACGVSGVTRGVDDKRKSTEPRHSISFNLIPPPSEQADEQRHRIRGKSTSFSFTHTNFSEFPLEAAQVDGRNFLSVAPIDETDIRKSLIVEAKRRKYWGTKALEKMVFENVEHSCCYRVWDGWLWQS